MTFGVGDAEAAGPLEIRWPSGIIQVVDEVPAGHIALVTESEHE